MSSLDQSYPPNWRGQGPVLAPAVGFQRTEQGSGAAFQVVDGACPGQVPGGCDHPGREAVVRDLQVHCPLEKGQDRGVELTAGEELESLDSSGPVRPCIRTTHPR
jgi:hypothetical protein